MRDIPVMLNGYKLTVVEPPVPKTRENDRGVQEVVVDRSGVTVFVVSLFAKQRVEVGQRAPKGEEIKVTLATDPGPGFDEDVRVELVSATISPYEIVSDRGTISGISFKALGLTLAAPARAEKGAA